MEVKQRFENTAIESSSAEVLPAGNSNLILVGLMGVGKTALGELCAGMLELDFVDIDLEIEALHGISVAELFQLKGEEFFRTVEEEVLRAVCSSTGRVIATGGGVVLSSSNRALLKTSGIVCHLEADPVVIGSRLAEISSRPLLHGSTDPVAKLAQLREERGSLYREVADYVVNTAQDDLASCARCIVHEFLRRKVTSGRSDCGLQKLHMELGARSYPLWLGAGLLRKNAATAILSATQINRACIVTHPRLRSAYADPVAQQLESMGVANVVIEIPPGESKKNLRTIERLYGEFVKARLDRKSAAIAVGGGVIGDMVGFAAASYLRGIRFVQVPTTLLAQVDSSIGGKTGVDLPAGKNLVGAFHQPTCVLLDPDTLKTLPVRELRSGLAEVIKYGIISDEAFFYQTQDDVSNILRRDAGALNRAIARSCEIKGAVVTEDETEQGLRAILNFGHTVGHALESVTRYRVYRHGEAISIGMVAACLVGEILGITPSTVTDSVRRCLRLAGLPVEFPEAIPFSGIHEAMLIDKKTDSGRLTFVLAEAIGRVRIVGNVSPEVVAEAIERQKPKT